MDLDESKLDECVHSISKKIDQDGWGCLSETERAVALGHVLALEISNGGIEKFFVNPSGERWRETLSAIKMVGASALAAIMERAFSPFPENAPSEERLTRCNQIKALGRPASELWDQLTDEYFSLQSKSADHCLYQRLTAITIQQLGQKAID